MGVFVRLGQFRITTGAIFVPRVISLLHYRSKILIVLDCMFWGLTREYLEDWVSLGLQLGQYLCLRLYCSWLIDTQLGFTAGRGSDHCF